MTDVSRALLLPGLHDVDDKQLVNLAMIWDDVVVPTYAERLLNGSSSEPVSQLTERLTAEGVVRPIERRLDLDSPTVTVPGLQSVTFEASEEAIAAMTASDEDAGYEVMLGTKHGAGHIVRVSYDGLVGVVASHVTKHLLARLADAGAVALGDNLAPVACSPFSHVGALVGLPSPNEGHAEAALLSVAAAGLELLEVPSAEALLKFREQTRVHRARLRASLGELAEEMRADAAPGQVLARAQARYQNRVVPALSEFEDVLKQNSLVFGVKALTRVTAVTLSPVPSPKLAKEGVDLAAETLKYTLSKKSLIRAHPYGLLVAAKREFDAKEAPFPALLSQYGSTEEALHELIKAEGLEPLVRGFIGLPD